MQVRVVLLASYRDLAGAAEVLVELPPEARAADAIAAVRGRSTRAALLPERPVIAVNQEYASLDVPLRDGDELALLPPVAGG
jgi:molybdopterin converting factor small subunit